MTYIGDPQEPPVVPQWDGPPCELCEPGMPPCEWAENGEPCPALDPEHFEAEASNADSE